MKKQNSIKDLIYFIKQDSAILYVNSKHLIKYMDFLNKHNECMFDMLLDHTAVDWLEEKKFDLIYTIYSTKYNRRLFIVSSVYREKPVIDSMSSIWKIAEWQEREVYDLYGVLYNNHKDLRRIFLEDDWLGFPLRKDYKDNFMLEK